MVTTKTRTPARSKVRFELCSTCRCHGHIILADGTHDVEACSKQHVHQRINKLFSEGRLNQTDADMLADGIVDISLRDILSSGDINKLAKDIAYLPNTSKCSEFFAFLKKATAPIPK